MRQICLQASIATLSRPLLRTEGKKRKERTAKERGQRAKRAGCYTGLWTSPRPGPEPEPEEKERKEREEEKKIKNRRTNIRRRRRRRTRRIRRIESNMKGKHAETGSRRT